MDEVNQKVSLEEEVFTLKYDGEALKNHTIDAKNLQLVVAGITEFLDAANTVVNKGACKLTIKFGVPKAGSIDFQVFVGIAKELLDVGSSAKVFLQYAFESMKLCVRTKGQKPQTVEQVGNGNLNITVNGDNNTVFVFPASEKAFNVSSDRNCRKGLKKMTETLKTEGYERYVGKYDGEEVTVSKKDAHVLLENSEEDVEPEKTETKEMWVHAVTSCDQKAGWKFREEKNPDNVFRATVEDGELLERFKRKGIASSDRICAKIEIITTNETEKQYFFIKILKYEPVRQLSLIEDDEKTAYSKNKNYF